GRSFHPPEWSGTAWRVPSRSLHSNSRARSLPFLVQRVENEKPRVRQRTAFIVNRGDRNARPLREVAPALDAAMQRGLCLAPHLGQVVERKTQIFSYQTAYFEPPVCEITRGQSLIDLVARRFSIDPRIRRNMSILLPGIPMMKKKPSQRINADLQQAFNLRRKD